MIISQITSKKVTRFVANPSQALIIASADDVYNEKLAGHIASLVLKADINSYAYYQKIIPKNNAIGIEQVRELSEFLKLKVPSGKAINRVCVVLSAQKMTHEAQNALLKNLEEPNDKTLIILCTSNLTSLLPTITSRCQKLLVTFPGLDQLTKAHENFSKTEVEKAYNQAGGLPELTNAILSSTDHPINEVTNLTKQFLSVSKFQRLILVNTFKEREVCRQLAEMSMQVARLGIKTGKDEKWQNIYQAAFQAKEMLEANVQSKLVMTKFSLSF